MRMDLTTYSDLKRICIALTRLIVGYENEEYGGVTIHCSDGRGHAIVASAGEPVSALAYRHAKLSDATAREHPDNLTRDMLIPPICVPVVEHLSGGWVTEFPIRQR